jgi:hypothetical protein
VLHALAYCRLLLTRARARARAIRDTRYETRDTRYEIRDTSARASAEYEPQVQHTIYIFNIQHARCCRRLLDTRYSTTQCNTVPRLGPWFSSSQETRTSNQASGASERNTTLRYATLLCASHHEPLLLLHLICTRDISLYK